MHTISNEQDIGLRGSDRAASSYILIQNRIIGVYVCRNNETTTLSCLNNMTDNILLIGETYFVEACSLLLRLRIDRQ